MDTLSKKLQTIDKEWSFILGVQCNNNKTNHEIQKEENYWKS